MKLVSAILPTRGRHQWANEAIGYFLAQTYPNKELVIWDDLEEPSFMEIPKAASVYCQSADRDIGRKRNLCCSKANGEIIWHLDSDDWSAPERMADQVRVLEESGKQLTGYHTVMFYGEHLSEDEKYQRYFCSTNWAVGTSLCFTKSWWKSHPFPENKQNNTGEDSDFVSTARHAREMITTDGGKLVVARIHPGNTARKNIGASQYRRVAREDFPEAFFQ